MTQTGIDVQEQFWFVIGVIWIVYPEFVAIHSCEFACDQFPVMIDLAIVFILIDTGEVVSINDTDAVALLHELQRLIHILHLIIVRMRCAVGCQQTIDAEGIEVRFVAIVATIRPKRRIAFFLQESLVHPVPDGCTHNTTIGIDHIPVLLQVTHRVTHGVGILTGYHWFFSFFDSLTAQFIGCRVAKVVQGGVARMTIVEGRAC